MIVVMRPGATQAQVADIVARLERWGCQVNVSADQERSVISVIGDGRLLDGEALERMAGVERTVPIQRPYRLAGRDFHPQDTVVTAGGVAIGGKQVVVMAGPCAVESRDQLLEAAWAVKEAGARMLRGGAFKPRTSPYSFQGLGEEGLRLLAEARQETGLPVVTEVVDPQTVPLVAQYADVLQVGARHMQHTALLHAVGEARRPVLLKRGMMATLEEWLMAAEYILSHGNDQVILCERGIRTFEPYTRHTLDINAVPLLEQLSHLPVVVDPSHGTGRWDLVEPVARAGVAAGADGLLIEVHPHPEQALSDGAQALTPAHFAALMRSLRAVAGAVGRTV